MNSAVTQAFIARIAGALVQARAVDGVKHLGLRGNLREVIVAQLLEPILPPGWGVGSGEVVTAFNDHSQQADIILYDKSIVPPVLVGRDLGLFPLESVIATIEVKSTLNATELKTADASARKTRKLPFSITPTAEGEAKVAPLVPLTAVFALDTDLTLDGITEIERYASNCGTDGLGLMQICVAGRGHWFWSDGTWHAHRYEGEHGEILGFIAALMYSTRLFARSRTAPLLQSYFRPP